jgi:cytoskeletal protein RodZ
MVSDELANGPALDGVGTRLRNAREEAGLSRTDIARLTKIPERQLCALEDGNYAALPARTYAIGFARSYARAVGLDEQELLHRLRIELDGVQVDRSRAPTPAFEPGDPARVPARAIAWTAAVLGVALIVALQIYWRNSWSPSGALPSILPADAPASAPAVVPSTAQAAHPAPVAGGLAGPVTFTAKAPEIWIKVHDAAGKVLLQKTLTQGETYTIPADAQGPMLRTGRPDALAVTVGGQAVAGLAGEAKLVDVPVSAAALLARGAPATSTPAGTPGQPASAPTHAAHGPAATGHSGPAAAQGVPAAPASVPAAPATMPAPAAPAVSTPAPTPS